MSAQAAVDVVFVSEVACFSRVKASLPVRYDAILGVIAMEGLVRGSGWVGRLSRRCTGRLKLEDNWPGW